MTKMFLALRISSAWGVVGAFAPSATILAVILSTFLAVICEPVAAGISMSQSVWKIVSGSIAEAFLSKPLMQPESFTCSNNAGMSSPSGLATAAEMSATATTFAPSFAISSAATEPTFPKPCTAIRIFLISRPSFSQAASMVKTTPLPVAWRLPRMPPSITGFPVTKHPLVIEVPCEYEMQSLMWAMSISFVPMSGAGM